MPTADLLTQLAADGLSAYVAAQLRSAVEAAQRGDAEALDWLQRCGRLHVELLAQEADPETVHRKLIRLAKGYA